MNPSAHCFGVMAIRTQTELVVLKQSWDMLMEALGGERETWIALSANKLDRVDVRSTQRVPRDKNTFILAKRVFFPRLT